MTITRISKSFQRNFSLLHSRSSLSILFFFISMMISIIYIYHQNFKEFSEKLYYFFSSSSRIIFTFFLDLNDYQRISKISQTFQRNFSISSLLRHLHNISPLFLNSNDYHEKFKKSWKKFHRFFSSKSFQSLQRNSISSPLPLPILVPSICILFLDPRDYHEFQGVGND